VTFANGRFDNFPVLKLRLRQVPFEGCAKSTGYLKKACLMLEPLSKAQKEDCEIEQRLHIEA
jgi:hypothetical protein